MCIVHNFESLKHSLDPVVYFLYKPKMIKFSYIFFGSLQHPNLKKLIHSNLLRPRCFHTWHHYFRFIGYLYLPRDRPILGGSMLAYLSKKILFVFKLYKRQPTQNYLPLKKRKYPTTPQLCVFRSSNDKTVPFFRSFNLGVPWLTLLINLPHCNYYILCYRGVPHCYNSQEDSYLDSQNVFTNNMTANVIFHVTLKIIYPPGMANINLIKNTWMAVTFLLILRKHFNQIKSSKLRLLIQNYSISLRAIGAWASPCVRLKYQIRSCLTVKCQNAFLLYFCTIIGLVSNLTH